MKMLYKIVEMTRKDLECDISLVDKPVVGSGGLTPILKKVILWVKCMLQRNHSGKEENVGRRTDAQLLVNPEPRAAW